MNTMKKLTSTIVFALLTTLTMAQSVAESKPSNVDFMTSTGKIMVVVTVILIIMAGFFAYLISVDRKIAKLEKNS